MAMAERPTLEDLQPYERQQGGFWEYGHGEDEYGNGKVWVAVPNPTLINEPIKTTVVRFKCPFCNRHHARKPKAVDHIARCWSNPENKTCRTCAFFVPALSQGCDVGQGVCDCGDSPEQCDLGIDLPESTPVVGCPQWQDGEQARWEGVAFGGTS